MKTRTAASSPRSAGITLTEILISILILGVGLVSLATLFPIGLLRLRDAQRLDAVGLPRPSRPPPTSTARGLLSTQLVYLRRPAECHELVQPPGILVRQAERCPVQPADPGHGRPTAPTLWSTSQRARPDFHRGASVLTPAATACRSRMIRSGGFRRNDLSLDRRTSGLTMPEAQVRVGQLPRASASILRPDPSTTARPAPMACSG